LNGTRKVRAFHGVVAALVEKLRTLVFDDVVAPAGAEGKRSEGEQQGLFADSKHAMSGWVVAGNNAAGFRGLFDDAV
jgi:hypothetical protein